MDHNLDYNLQLLDQYKVNRPGATEVVRQRLYDFTCYSAAGATQFTFFALPIGQGKSSSSGATSGTTTIPKTYADTNMEVAGVLPRPKSYLIESIEIIFEPGAISSTDNFSAITPSFFNSTAAAAVLAQVADVNLLRITGWFELYIGSKTYLWEAPLGVFPPKVHMEIDAALSASGGTSAGVPLVGITAQHWGGRAYYMDPMITLESLQNFAAYIKFPTAQATPSGFNGRLGVAFDGVMYRLSQ